MNGNRRWLLTFIVALLNGCLALSVSAQGTSSGTVVLGQPLPGQITAGQTLNYDYTVAKLSQVTLQALGATTQPTINILRDGTVVASQPNAENALTVTLSATLDAGSYLVQVGALNNTEGLVVLVLQSETGVTSTPLTPANRLTGVANNSTPLSIYSFSAIDTLDSYLYIDTNAKDSGVTARILNQTTGAVSAEIDAGVLGARLRIPAGSASYQVEVRQSIPGSDEPFSVCLAPVGTSGCEAGSAQPTIAAPVVTQEIAQPTVEAQGCILTGKAPGGVNIRQSATTNSIIVGNLPDGAFANVIGMSPDKIFFNVLYNGSNGWIADAVASLNGDCSGILIINPPPPIVPTAAPVQQQAAPTDAGPCRLTIQSPTFVYTQTTAIPDYLFDQAQPGAQVSPLGRLADNSWWKVLELGYNSWLPTSTFGNGVQVSGNCSNLPIVSP